MSVSEKSSLKPISRALISVSNKAGIVDFAQALVIQEIEIISTGGTAKMLTQAGIDCRDVSELTGFPEMMDGRVKTLHPMVHGGLLAIRDNETHTDAMRDHGVLARLICWWSIFTRLRRRSGAVGLTRRVLKTLILAARP